MHIDHVMSVRRIADAISAYLRVNPLACDTCDGIARWWLVTDRFADGDVALALAWLESSAVVERVTAADGRVRYRRTSATTVGGERVSAGSYLGRLDDGASRPRPD